MQTVTEVRSLDELAKLRLTWRTLWNETPEASFCQSYDWIRSYLRFYGEGLKLRTLLVTVGTKPMGIIPLVIRPVRTTIGSATVLTWPGEAWSSFLGPVGSNSHLTWEIGLKHLQNASRDWNVIELSGVAATGVSAERQRKLLEAGGLSLSQTGCLHQPVVELAGTWDQYLMQRSNEWKIQYAQSEQLIRRSGPCSFHRWRPDGTEGGQTDRRWDFFQAIERMRLESATCSSQAEIELAFLRDVHPAAVDAASIDICLLNVGDEPVAGVYSYRRGKTVEPLMLVANSRFKDAAMYVLMCHMIRDSFSRGDELVRFRSEHSEIADPWATGLETSLTFGHYTWMSPQAQALRLRARKGKATAAAALPMSGIADTATTLRLYKGA